ncbi:hypothetical protein EMCRGX_G029472 [Ephydatia muelleri]
MANRSWLLRLAVGGLSRASCRYKSTQQPAKSVTDEQVQKLLTRMTGLDLDKVFKTRREPLSQPVYKLVDEHQLKKAQMETVERARELLQMPPVLPQRKEKGELIQGDAKLAGLEDTNVVFTDISQTESNSSRRIVVREKNGNLREATWNERDRMCQIYFPALGRQLTLPAMLQGSDLARLLKEQRHEEVLERANIQCEPDSVDYIRVHHAVYDDIASRGLYDLLRSTRHFGGLLWYLMTRQLLKGIVEDMLERNLIEDAIDLVGLFKLCYPDYEFSKGSTKAGKKCVQEFCEHHGWSDLATLASAKINAREPCSAQAQ